MKQKYGSTMKSCLILGFCICYALLSPSSLSALDGPGASGASYLTLPIGPKSIAMGEVQAALIGDPFNWLSNPGALQYMEGSGLGVLHAEWIIDTRYDNLSYHHRINNTITVSGGFVFTYRPDIQGYNEFGAETKTLKNNNYQALVGVGFSPIEAFTAGINIKYFNEKLDEWTAGGLAVDIGALYTFKEADISFGIAAQNLGPDIKFESLEEPLPMTIRAGASHSMPVMDDNYKFSYAFDLVKPRYESIYLGAGCELEIYELLAVRAGYCSQEYRSGNGFTMGGGVKLKERIIMDYAWTPYGDLGSFHRMSLFFVIR